jgi:hypothetical protein
MKQGELFLSVCGTLKDTSSSDVDSTVSTSTETTGQTHTKECIDCGSELVLGDNWTEARQAQAKYVCKSCWHEGKRAEMWVNGKYVPKAHPLWKAGRYKSFGDAAFSSLENYERSREGQVYIITNSAWPEWVKIGMAIDAEDRLNGYQTSSPFRNYRLMYSVSTNDRRKAEAAAHKAAEKIADRKGEWFKMSVGQAKECIQNGL